MAKDLEEGQQAMNLTNKIFLHYLSIDPSPFSADEIAPGTDLEIWKSKRDYTLGSMARKFYKMIHNLDLSVGEKHYEISNMKNVIINVL